MNSDSFFEVLHFEGLFLLDKKKGKPFEITSERL